MNTSPAVRTPTPHRRRAPSRKRCSHVRCCVRPSCSPSNAILAHVLGVARQACRAWRRALASSTPTSKEGELALLLVRAYRSLDALVGADDAQRRAWMSGHNHALAGAPIDLIQRADGLVAVVAYSTACGRWRDVGGTGESPFDKRGSEAACGFAAKRCGAGRSADVIASMKLVDNAAEQQLEELLETSKPAPPRTAQPLHYLIFTPFRYRPAHPSRFRPAHSPGLWYGAAELETACAEVAYWKWRFLMDSDALADQALHTQHTFFQAEIAGPLHQSARATMECFGERWQHPTDYGACQQLAAAAREP